MGLHIPNLEVEADTKKGRLVNAAFRAAEQWGPHVFFFWPECRIGVDDLSGQRKEL
jgi:hypothetical protein